MCNPAEQVTDYSSDPQKNNVLVSQMDDLAICADTCARDSEGTSKAIANHSDVAAAPMSSALSKEANGVGGDHSYITHKHFAKEVPIPVRGSQEIGEEMADQTGEPSKACLTMTTSFSAGNWTDKDGTHRPGFHAKNSSKTSGYVCDPNLVEFEDDVYPMSAESRKVETKPIENGTLSEKMSAGTESQMEGGNFEKKEVLPEASEELVGDSATLARLPDGANGETFIKAVEAQSCTPVSGGSQSAMNPAKELSVDPCKGAENTETQPDIVHTDRTIEIDECSVLEGLGVGSEGHSTGPSSERDKVKSENNPDVKSDVNKEVLRDFNKPLAWIEMRPGVAEQTAASAEESTGGALRIASNVEETKNESAAKSLETQNTQQRPKQVTQDVVVSNDRVETWIPTTAMSSEEDAAEHAPRSFKEANGEFQSEIEQEGTIASSDSTYSKGSSRPDLAEFFSNARGSEPEKEIEEQECAPVMMKVPLKKKLFMESPRSLRMLLFSEETALSTKKDGKTMEFSSKVVPAKESRSNETRTEHSYPAKWYESSDNEEASNIFSGPMAFSGALTHQGVVSYSGQIPYSGSISHRSDSSTSTRSFAFPILASDWNSSPVRMGPPDPWFQRRPQRKWHFCFCCRRTSSWCD